MDHGYAFSETAPSSPFERDRRTSFQSAVGGGLDIAFGRKLAWRALQVEERSAFDAAENRHRVSLSSGLVFSFGGRKSVSTGSSREMALANARPDPSATSLPAVPSAPSVE